MRLGYPNFNDHDRFSHTFHSKKQIQVLSTDGTGEFHVEYDNGVHDFATISQKMKYMQ